MPQVNARVSNECRRLIDAIVKKQKWTIVIVLEEAIRALAHNLKVK
jgi:hypothetical protein